MVEPHSAILGADWLRLQVTSQAYCGLVAGLAIATLTTIFLPVSGAHINPAVSVSAATIQVSCRQYSPLIGQTALNTHL